MYLPTSEYEDNEMEKLYDTIEEILEDGKGDTNVILGNWNSVVGDESYRNIVGTAWTHSFVHICGTVTILELVLFMHICCHICTNHL